MFGILHPTHVQPRAMNIGRWHLPIKPCLKEVKLFCPSRGGPERLHKQIGHFRSAAAHVGHQIEHVRREIEHFGREIEQFGR